MREALLAVEGIHCSACTQLIELRVAALPGIEHVSVNLATHRARVRYRAAAGALGGIIAAITRAGYRAWPIGAADAARQRSRVRRLALWRLFVAGFAMMQVMMYAFPAYVAIPGEMEADTEALLRYASLVLTLPVLLFSAAPLLQGAWRDLHNRRIGMDVPVALGIAVTFLGSTWNTVTGGGAVYFDTLCMFVFVLLAGRYLEMLARERASAAIEELTRLQPQRAERLLDFPASLATEEIDATELRPGDHVLVRAGMAMPADGEVVRGESHCDEALLTGESRPLRKAPGLPVTGGALNLEQALCIRVTRAGMNTQLAGIVRMMEQASMQKPALVELADRHAGHFLWGVLALALAAGAAWAQTDPARGLWVAITILIVTCPCALALAAPVAMSAAIGSLARRGVLVTHGKALDALARATHFVFDKTGTLTTGRMQLLGIETFGRLDRDTALRIAAALEESAVHPVARAVCMEAARLSDMAGTSIAEVREVTGQGVEGRIDGTPYRLGRAEFALSLTNHMQDHPQVTSTGQTGAPDDATEGAPEGALDDARGLTQITLADASGPLARFGFGDGTRAGAAELIASLHRAGHRAILLSGDAAHSADRVGAALALDEVRAGMQPQAKRDYIAALQTRGALVAMIGDGINDAPALALADVSIAMGSGAPLAQARADMVLMSARPADLEEALRIARLGSRVIRQNLGWAALYNLIAVPLAALGLLTPWAAGIGMSLSSLVVVVNSLRLLRERPAHTSAVSPMQPAASSFTEPQAA